MTTRKTHNSIVFLTTLYLGLMLVGAAPQALNFAALTRNFDIQNEVEVKDDLDNKPDNEEIEVFSKDDFPALFAQFLQEIKEEVESGKILLPIQTDFYTNGDFYKSEFASGGGSGGGSISSTVSDQHLSLFTQNAVNQKFRSKAFDLADFDLADFDSKNSKNVKVRIEADGTDFSLRISFGKSNAEQFAEFLNQEFSSNAALVKDKLTKEVYEHTKATSENNQVFVITRLPRGSLESLLTDSAR